MYAKMFVVLMLAFMAVGCTDPDLLDPSTFDNVTPGSPAFSKIWNEKTQTISIVSPVDVTWLTIEKVSAVPDLCTFTEILNVTAHVNYNLNSENDFNFGWAQHSGKNGVTSVDVSKLINESYDIVVDEYDIIQVNETVYNNETELNETITVNRTVVTGNHTEIRYRDVWQAWTPAGNTLFAGDSVMVKIVYHKPAELGDVRIQTIPIFGGVECEELTWWNSSWTYRRNLTVNHSMVSGAQTNFPSMVSINQTGLNANATDLRVTDSTDNQVAREIECYNQTSGELVFFFNGTSISNTTDTSFWVYYNNSDATEPAANSTYGSEAVWDSNFYAVYHMTGTASLIDSTSNGNTLAKVGTPTLADSDYGKCVKFESSAEGQYFGAITSAGLAGSVTISAWSKLESNGNTEWPHMIHLGTTGHWQSINYDFTPDEYETWQATSGGTYVVQASKTITLNQWEYISARYDEANTDLFLYYNGTQLGSTTGTAGTFDPADYIYVAHQQAQDRRLDGWIGEVRVSTTLRPVTWELTTYNNLNNPTATGTAPFYLSFGAEECMIASYAPETPLTKTEGESQLFNVTTVSDTQCRWYIDESLVQTNETLQTEHNYTNSSLEIGYWNFSAVVNLSGETTTAMQTWWVTVTNLTYYDQDMYIDRWMYVTNLDDTNLNLSEFFTQLNPYYLTQFNATDQKSYGYKSGRWEKYGAYEAQPGEAVMLRYTANITKYRYNATETFGLTLKTGLNHIGHSYNGIRALSWYNTTIASSNLSTIQFQYPKNGTLKLYTYGSADNGTVEVPQGVGVEVNVTAETVISGL